MKKHVLYWLGLVLIVIAACQKETSFETGGSPAEGSLQSDVSGDCLPKTVTGSYVAGTTLVSTASTITVSVNVTKTGTYAITTDTVNGYYFKGTGTFTTLGPTNVTLQGNGTPFASGVNNFVVKYGSSVCDIQVTVLPSGTGPAVFTLNGAPAACTTPTINGTYVKNAALTPANTVVLNVTVTTAGSYNVSTTPVNGMTFAGTGTLATGNQTITLVGTGTPTTAGNNTIPVTVAATTCNFVINVVDGAQGSLDGGPGACAPITVNGTYTINTAVTAANNAQIRIDVTTAGPYNITTNTVSGLSFSASGNATVGNDQTITLNATGTPTASGVLNFTVTFGTSTCTFSVTVAPAPSADYFPRTAGSNWSYEIDDVALDSFYRTVISATHNAAGNSWNIFMFDDGAGLDSSGYYRKSGGDYYEWFDYGSWIGYDNPAWGEYIMLKDNVAQGTNWKTGTFNGTVGGTPLSIRFSYTILQKDVAVNLTTSTGTVAYTNVIVVKEELEAFDGTNWVNITAQIDYSGRSYYARGIGLIKFEEYDGAGTLISQQELRRKVVL